MSTTSGLGSNYTTSGLSCSIGGGSTQSPTPLPRRKTSSTSFSEVPEIQQQQQQNQYERLEHRQPVYIPGNYIDYHQPHQVIEKIQNLPNDGAAYFRKF